MSAREPSESQRETKTMKNGRERVRERMPTGEGEGREGGPRSALLISLLCGQKMMRTHHGGVGRSCPRQLAAHTLCLGPWWVDARDFVGAWSRGRECSRAVKGQNPAPRSHYASARARLTPVLMGPTNTGRCWMAGVRVSPAGGGENSLGPFHTFQRISSQSAREVHVFCCSLSAAQNFESRGVNPRYA